jgi:hypothetical protein
MLRRFLWSRRIPVAGSLVNRVCVVGVVCIEVGWVTSEFAKTEVAVGATQFAVAVALLGGERPKPLSVGTSVWHPNHTQARDLLETRLAWQGLWKKMCVRREEGGRCQM